MKTFKRVILSTILFTSIIIGVASTIHFLEEAGFFNLIHSDVKITNSLSQQNYLSPLVLEIDEIVKNYHQTSLWKLNLNEIAKKIQAKKWVSEVNISRQWPNEIQVSIEMKPIKLNLLLNNKQFYPVTEDAEILPEADFKNIPDLAILRGENFERSIDLRKKAIQLISQIPNAGTFSAQAISEIFYDNKEGFTLRMSKGGLIVKLGNDQFAIKGARLNKVLEYINAKAINAYLVDANLSKKVLVKLKNGHTESKFSFE